MKVVINKCYGGFSLSRAAVKRLAELQGRPCYFFTHLNDEFDKWVPSEEPESGRDLFWAAFDIPNPDEVLRYSKPWHEMPLEDKQQANDLHTKHGFDQRPADRADPLLVQVVEELGEAANGRFAELAIVEIPDGTEWEIDEYDGMEHIAEKHRTWY